MQIRIKGYTFQLREPFAAGTVITKGEAQALNDLRAENIQNNLRRDIAAATEGLTPGELIPQAQLQQLQAELTEYDLEYQFGEKKNARARRGDIEVEARAIALERIEVALRAQNRQVGEEDLERLIAQQELLPAVIEEARARVAAKRRANAGGLEDL